MKVYSANPERRVALRVISAYQTALPPLPGMPTLSGPASNWPASPVPWTALDGFSRNYDNTAVILGLVGGHTLAYPPNAIGPEAPPAGGAGFVTFSAEVPAASPAGSILAGALTLLLGVGALWWRRSRTA